MFKNYFVIAVRNLLRQRVYSFINILGLAVGIACVVLISFFVQYEFSYDKHLKNADRIYRIPTVLGSYRTKDAPLPLAHTLTEKYPEVEKAARLLWMEPPYPYFSPDEVNRFQETKAYYADSTIFDIFSLELIEGNTATALTQAQSVVLSQSAAKRFFGSERALNKTIRLNNKTDLKVTGVYADFPHNTHIAPEILISSTTNKLMLDNSAANWEWLYSSSTYVLLRESASVDKMNSELSSLFWKVTGYNKEAYGADYTMSLQPITYIHLQSHYAGENNGSISVIYTFSAIGFVIIVIAAINFMNLATVRSLRRAREVGMRKVMGGHQANLVAQFLTESIATVLLSAIVGLALVAVSIRPFNELIGTQLTLDTVFRPQSILLLTIFAIVLGLLSGLYPAFFLSGHNPAQVLKGKFSTRVGSIRLRKSLVMAQFAIGFTVLVGTFVVNSQLNFMINKDLGYTKDNVITLFLPADSIGVDRVREQLAALPHVIAASKMSESFNNVQGWLVPWYEGAPVKNDFSVTRFHTDHYFKEVAGLQIVAGRFFNEDFKGDSSSFVLNETAVKKLGWKNEDAVGKLFGGQRRPGRVIGVVKDFNFRHLAQPVTPFVFFPPNAIGPFEKGRIAIKTEAGHGIETVKEIQQKWNELVPQWPLKYSYLDNDLASQYQSEAQLNKLTSVFSALAVFISALGLLGLASFSIAQRIKEIGIRKVLGASVKNIVMVTTKDFIILVCFGMALGIPLAYFASSQWLNVYSNRVPLSVTAFVLAFTLSLLIAIATVASVALKASSANPVDSLRTD